MGNIDYAVVEILNERERAKIYYPDDFKNYHEAYAVILEETVFTPFLGIGSEAYMAVKNDRNAIGIELKDSYFEVAYKNIKKAASQKLQIELFK